VAHVEDGILDTRTPVMKFHLGYCTFCKKCTEVCPTQALVPFDIKTVKIGLAAVTDRCIAWNSGGCVVCQRACPYHAIALDGQNRPIVDSAKCNGCGLCEKVCPALVLRSYIGGTVRGIEVRPISQGGAS
jgi:ferredoxin-type protein NapG